eukprot:TRINITY_DN10678_c0_g1_i1.p1 TRINITY_DN10678_c0_g1~~TRINITY_DN10678_c0_g1_i1.p1  ORF type:complete len:393 (-),score=102.19 TRINITY_DN10678_c0_g1_i1:56-1207(-)
MEWSFFVVVEVIEVEDFKHFQNGQNCLNLNMTDNDEDMEIEIEEIENTVVPPPMPMSIAAKAEPLLIRSEWKSSFDQQIQQKNQKQVQVCPLCRQSVPMKDIEEHIRIELLYPRYQLEKKAHLTKKKHDALAIDEEIANSLGSFFKKQLKSEEELVGNSSTTTGHNSNGSAQTKPKSREYWDGHSSSISSTTSNLLSLNQQIAALHAKNSKSENSSPLPAVGPNLPCLEKDPGSDQINVNTNMQLRNTISIDQVSQGYPVSSSPFSLPPFKKQKIETETIVPEEEFLANSLTRDVKVEIQLPHYEKDDWNLRGQLLKMDMNITDKVEKLKQKIEELVGIPRNKQNLKKSGLSFLKDSNSLAFYNISSSSSLSLVVKGRAGRAN